MTKTYPTLNDVLKYWKKELEKAVREKDDRRRKLADRMCDIFTERIENKEAG
jgi:uncharacterized protein Usg